MLEKKNPVNYLESAYREIVNKKIEGIQDVEYLVNKGETSSCIDIFGEDCAVRVSINDEGAVDAEIFYADTDSNEYEYIEKASSFKEVIDVVYRFIGKLNSHKKY